jgi:hypothetical protein
MVLAAHEHEILESSTIFIGLLLIEALTVLFGGVDMTTSPT